jgi:hypothetical protein
VPRRARLSLSAVIALALVAGLASAGPSQAENRVGGHFGIVFPLFTDFDGESIDLSDDFRFGFPMGITIKKGERLAFDLELVANVNDNPIDVDLVIHPGVLWGLENNLTLGLRFATEVDGDAWGFTPLIAKGFPIKGKDASYFIELDLPLRVQENALGESEFAYTVAFHTGIGF